MKRTSGLPNVSFTSAHRSHILCGMSIHNIHLETGLCRIVFLVLVRLSFGLSWAIVRGHGQETESAHANVLKGNLSLLCMAVHDIGYHQILVWQDDDDEIPVSFPLHQFCQLEASP